MKFEAVLFEVMRAVPINCKLTWAGLTFIYKQESLNPNDPFTLANED